MWALARVGVSSPLGSRPVRASTARTLAPTHARVPSRASPSTAAAPRDDMATDWESMWRGGGEPLRPGQAFDAARCEPSLVALLETGTLPTGRALVPGCGRGYAVEALCSRERDVLGLEVSETAKRAAEAYLASSKKPETSKHAKIAQDNFFEHAPATPYDLAFDSTFLCAIPPSRRKEWASKYASLIRPGGELVSNVFPNGDFEGGPPFALSPKIVADLLVPVGFEAVSLTDVPETQWARGRQEYLYRFRRT